LVEVTAVILPHTTTSLTLRWIQSVVNVVRPGTHSSTVYTGTPTVWQHNDSAFSVQLTRPPLSVIVSQQNEVILYAGGKLSRDVGFAHSSSSSSGSVTSSVYSMSTNWDAHSAAAVQLNVDHVQLSV